MGEVSKHPFEYEIKRNGTKFIINNVIIRNLRKFIERIKTEHINERTMASFINEIKGKVDVVIDIRYNTFFKRNQGFKPEIFQIILATHNIEYFYFQDLGNPYHKKNQDKPIKAKQDYLKYLEKRLFARSNKPDLQPHHILTHLFNKIAHSKDYQSKNFCLICYCATTNPSECHRFWLKEKLINMKRTELNMPGDYIMEV